MNYLLLFPVLFPVIYGVVSLRFKNMDRRKRKLFFLPALCLNSTVVFVLAFLDLEPLDLAVFANHIRLSLFLDGPARLFSCMVAVLWIPATIYAFSYMEHEREHLAKDAGWVNSFFAFYIMTYGVTVGLAYSANPLTMYIFFEALSLVTFPLVIHIRDHKSIKAARKYLKYMLGGAAFGFISLICVLIAQEGEYFAFGGIIDVNAFPRNLLLFTFVCGFCGFGVKTALFPFGSWLISASVAVTPVTALLHAVAVVKGGAFVLIRLTYYGYGTDYLKGSWAHYVCLFLVCATILYGSTMAVRETHLKRRLAYSTMANLSYVLLGVCSMSGLGLCAALLHMVYHAFMKINSFFCVGVVMQREGRSFVDECNGIGKRLPWVMAFFTVSGLALTGIPPFIGFISKWTIASALVETANPAFYAAVGVLMYSAFCTAIYMLSLATRAWFPPKANSVVYLEARKPDFEMWGPLAFFTLVIIILSFTSTPLVNALMALAAG
ncbi:MAG: proton-conducting membrane transporter [Lachnospiraceae bacterium]|nr:proton-conducting membrane transporter [Lachnospiraceae bacterium]